MMNECRDKSERVRETRGNEERREKKEGCSNGKEGTVPENHKENGKTLSLDWSGLDAVQSDAS